MITEHEVRLALPGDAAWISELSRGAIEYGLAQSWTPKRVARSIVDSSTNVAVALHASSPAGFAIMKYGDEVAHVHLLAVHPAQRRKGIGSALLSWLEATARTAGIDLIRLEARARNDAAISFYRKHGFVELGRRKGYYQGVEDAVRMAKDLWL